MNTNTERAFTQFTFQSFKVAYLNEFLLAHSYDSKMVYQIGPAGLKPEICNLATTIVNY